MINPSEWKQQRGQISSELAIFRRGDSFLTPSWYFFVRGLGKSVHLQIVQQSLNFSESDNLGPFFHVVLWVTGRFANESFLLRPVRCRRKSFRLRVWSFR